MLTPQYSYRYPRPGVTADVILLHSSPEGEKVLLIRRRDPPYAGRWALPGGFVEKGETLATAARRELYEETGLGAGTLRQFAAFGEPGRDPRGWTISVVFWGEVKDTPRLQAGDDAAAARWWPWDELPPLAFDHRKILAQFREPTG
ncbi:MAG TPA: NUDIX hydrolase [Thermoflexia bacterium]|nr:NUDIX hydrolase [Thermoflexia bacterium]